MGIIIISIKVLFDTTSKTLFYTRQEECGDLFAVDALMHLYHSNTLSNANFCRSCCACGIYCGKQQTDSHRPSRERSKDRGVNGFGLEPQGQQISDQS